METKNLILERLKKNVLPQCDMPQLEFQPVQYENPVEAFIQTSKTSAGARVFELAATDNVNELIKKAYPDAKVIASNLPGIDAERNPDLVETAQELDGTDVGVIKGEIGCAENGCIWIPQTMKEKAVCFISENLVIILSKKNIVSNMHEAYDRIQFTDYGFGTFISGPSKTADIAQALVYGAQAARSVTIILTE